jgi:hypothetical protein
MIKTKDAGFIVDDELLRSCSLVALTAVRDLFTCAKHLFVAAITVCQSPPGALRGSQFEAVPPFTQRKSNNARVNPLSSWSDERTIAHT